MKKQTWQSVPEGLRCWEIAGSTKEDYPCEHCQAIDECIFMTTKTKPRKGKINQKEKLKKLVRLRKCAKDQQNIIDYIVKEATKFTGEDTNDNCWTHDYITGGGNLKKIMKIISLNNKKKFKEAGKEIQLL